VKMREAGCDLVTLGTIVQDTIIPVVTARKMGWNVDFLVNVAGYTTETIAAAQGGTEGLYSMTQIQAPYDDSPLPAVKDWLARYKAKNNADGTIQALAGYIAMDIFVMGADKAGKTLITWSRGWSRYAMKTSSAASRSPSGRTSAWGRKRPMSPR